MNPSPIRRALLLAFLAVVTPAAIGAQQAQPETQAISEDEVDALVAEYQQVHYQLEDIQREALQDPELGSIQEQLGSRIRQAMESHDPSIPERIARAEALEAELVSAQQAGDIERLQALIAEVEQIERHFITVQQTVITEPAIAGDIVSFQTRLEQKMGELDPGAAALIARFKELETRIEEAMRAGA